MSQEHQEAEVTDEAVSDVETLVSLVTAEVNATNGDQKSISTGQLAAISGCRFQMINQYLTTDRIHGYRNAGGSWRINKDEAIRWMVSVEKGSEGYLVRKFYKNSD